MKKTARLYWLADLFPHGRAANGTAWLLLCSDSDSAVGDADISQTMSVLSREEIYAQREIATSSGAGIWLS